MALSLPHLAPARDAFASWDSPGRDVPEYMAWASYRNVQVLVVGWELRHVWEDLRQLDVPEISFARRENYFEALACRPTTIVYNSDRGARPPIVGGLIGIAPPAFVAVGGDSLLEALSLGADAVFHLPEGLQDRHTRDRQALYKRQQVLETMATALKRGIRRVQQPCQLTAEGGLHLRIQGILSLHSPIPSGVLDMHIPPPGLLDRFSPGPTRGQLISNIFAAGRVEDGAIVHPMPEVQQYLSSFQPAQLEAACFMPQRTLPALQLMQQEPRAIDLATSNPVLFWLLIDKMQRRHLLPEEAAPMALAKQTVLLGELLGDSQPAPQRKVKLCKRFELPTPPLPKHLAVIRKTLQSEALSLGFRHWQRIPYRFLEMEDPLIPYSNWLRESSKHGTEPGPREVQPLLRDTLELAEELGHAPERVLGCRTRQQVVQLHDQYVEARNQQQQELDRKRNLREISFPAPPFSGTEHIQPIRDSQALDREGQDMHHCVGIYAKNIPEGSRFIYRVLQPERATLELVFNSRWGWRIGQLVSFHNHPVQDETRNSVEAWLAQARRHKEQEQALERQAAAHQREDGQRREREHMEREAHLQRREREHMEREREQEDMNLRPEDRESHQDVLRRHQSWAPRQWRVDALGRIMEQLNDDPQPIPPRANNRRSNDFPSIFSRKPLPPCLQPHPIGPDAPNPPPQARRATRETKGRHATRSLDSLPQFFGLYLVFRLFDGPFF